MTFIEAQVDADSQPADRADTDLILDFDLSNPKHLRWAASQYDRHAAELRSTGDLAGAVAAQVRADRYRSDAASVLRSGGSGASSTSFAFSSDIDGVQDTAQNQDLAEATPYDTEQVDISGD